MSLRGINSVIIGGNLTRDPELRSVGADKVVCNISLAHNVRFKGADGQPKEEVTFVDVTLWGQTAEIAARYLTKGMEAAVEGSLAMDNWTDKDGQKRSKLKLKGNRLHLPSREKSDEGHDGGEPAEQNGQAAPAPAARPAAPARTGARPAASAPVGGDDEPPF